MINPYRHTPSARPTKIRDLPNALGSSLIAPKAGKVLRRLGHSVTTLPDLDDWHLPKALLYIFGFATWIW